MKANTNVKTETVMVPQTVEHKVVTLELTEQEAQVLRVLAGNISGPSAGPRGVMDRIYHVLSREGFTQYRSGSYGVTYEGTIHLSPTAEFDKEQCKKDNDATDYGW